MIKSLKNKFNDHLFLRQVSMLVGGTAIGQLIAILALPVLTRLYDPEAFSVLAVYVSILSLLTVVACLRLEIAIPLPKSNRVAAALCVLSITSVLFFTLLSSLVIFFIPVSSMVNSEISQIIWLIPMGFFAVGMYNALQYWGTRNNRFGLISKTRVTQSISGTTIKLGAGYLMGGWTAGLIFGQLIAQGAGFLSLGRSLIKNDWNIFKKLKKIHFKLALARYKNFPIYSTWEGFANSGGIQIPVILIAYYAVGAEAGFLMIAMQLLSAPMSLIGNAVAQVYLTGGAERYYKGELKAFTHKTVLNLSKLAFFPLLFAAAVSPFLMPYILGEEWSRTGMLISWMVPWFFMQFITSPVSMALHITSNQKAAFLLQILGLVLRVGSVLLAASLAADWIAEVYAVSGFIFYSIYLLVIINIISKAKGIRGL